MEGVYVYLLVKQALLLFCLWFPLLSVPRFMLSRSSIIVGLQISEFALIPPSQVPQILKEDLWQWPCHIHVIFPVVTLHNGYVCMYSVDFGCKTPKHVLYIPNIINHNVLHKLNRQSNQLMYQQLVNRINMSKKLILPEQF